MERQLLTLDEVAWHLRLSHMTIYRMIQRGELKAIKIANQWRFPRESVERWLVESMPPKTLEPPSFVRRETTDLEKKYRPAFHQFVRDVIDTQPDVVALVDRRGARLFSEWEEPCNGYGGTITCYRALDCVPDADISGKYIALLDDCMQHGATLHHKRKDLEKRNALVHTFAFIGCSSFLSGKRELEDPEVQVGLTLADSEFTRTCAEVTEYLLEQGKTQDTDHFALLLAVRGKKGPVTLEQFLKFLNGLGHVFVVPSPAEENDIVTITLDQPTFFDFETRGLPMDMDLGDGVIKTRFYFNLRTSTCLCLPIVMPKVRLDPKTYFDVEGRDRSLPINLKKLGLQYDQLPEEKKAKCCYHDLTINISLALAEQTIRQLTSKRSPFRISLGEPSINRDDLQRCYGQDLGNRIADRVLQHLGRATKVQVGIPYQDKLPESESQSAVTRLSTSHLAERQLEAIFDVMPVIKLLTNWYDELKTIVSDREERLTDHGLTFSEICQRLEGQMEPSEVSFALDLGLDRTIIAPVHLMVLRENNEWEIRKAYRPGESAPGEPPEVGHRDSKALDTALFRFRRDKFLLPLVVDGLMRYCPSQRSGVEPYLLLKVLACLRRDWLTKGTREKWTYWEVPAAEFGPLPEIPRSSGLVEDGGNPYQLAQAGGSFCEYKAVQLRSARGKESTKKRFVPMRGWREIVQQYYDGEELSNIDAYVELYATMYNRLDGYPTGKPSVDTLLTLSACFDEENTYKYAHANLSLWTARFGHFLDLCRERFVCGTTSADIGKAIEACERTAWSALDKLSRYENLRDTKGLLRQTIEKQGNLVLLKLGREVLGRIDETKSPSSRLLMLRQTGELMRAISTLARYVFSRVPEFGVRDTRPPDEEQNKLGDYVEQAVVNGEGLIRAKERLAPFQMPDDSISLDTLRGLTRALDLIYQEMRLSFDSNCPEPAFGPEEDPQKLLRQINFAEQCLRKYAVKEGIFVFTDLDKSTLRFSELDPVEIAKLIQWYESSMNGIIEQFEGEVRKPEGDGKFVIFRDAQNALTMAVVTLQKISQLVEDMNLLPMGVGVCKGSYLDLETAEARLNELGSKINWAKKLASIDPPGLYITEDLLDPAKQLNIDCEVHQLPEAFKSLGQRVFRAQWNLVNRRNLIK